MEVAGPSGSAGSGATEEGLNSRGGRHLRLPHHLLWCQQETNIPATARLQPPICKSLKKNFPCGESPEPLTNRVSFLCQGSARPTITRREGARAGHTHRKTHGVLAGTSLLPLFDPGEGRVLRGGCTPCDPRILLPMGY